VKSQFILPTLQRFLEVVFLLNNKYSLYIVRLIGVARNFHRGHRFNGL